MKRSRFRHLTYAVVSSAGYRWAEFVERTEAVAYLRREREDYPKHELRLHRITRPA